MAVVASATGAAVFGLSGVAAGLAGGALLGAGAGALYSGITGDGNVLNSALTGGLIGGGIGGLGAAAFGAPATLSAVPTAAGGASPALVAAQSASAATTPAQLNAIAAAQGVVPEMAASLPGQGLLAAPEVLPATIAPATVNSAASQLANVKPTTGMDMLGYGLAGTAALSLLGGMNQKKLSGTDIPGQNPAMIRPYTYNVTQNTSAYPTGPQYGANGLPILPTSEQKYFNQSYTAGTPYKAAAGGLMAAPPVPGMMQSGPADVNFMGNDMYPTSQQHRSFYATPTQMPTSAQEAMASYEPKTNPLTGQMMKNMADGGMTGYAPGGETDSDDDTRMRKIIMKNLKGASTEDLRMAMDAMDEQKFLMKNMPNYAAAMSPSVSSMVEGAQYGDRMSKSYMDKARDNALRSGQEFVAPSSDYMRVQPTGADYKSGTYGGIASIGKQIDPDTRVNLMANLQRTPYDRNALEAVRRIEGGVSKQLDKDSTLSAYYGQDPMGRDRSGGVRYTQNFNQGGGINDIYNLGSYSDGGRLLKGPGDGVSDDIPAVIGNKQPARLADGEFVIPARIVSELGNGSTDAGAKRLYAMMDKIQDGRKKTIGKNNVAKDTKAKKHLLA